MLLDIIAPELPIAQAIIEWSTARRDLKRSSEFVERDNVWWTKAHCFFANSGGFILYFSESYDIQDLDRESRMQPDSRPSKTAASSPNSKAGTTRKAFPDIERFESEVKRFEERYGSSGWKVLKRNRNVVEETIIKQMKDREHLKEPFKESLVNLQGNYWTMNSNQLFYCREIGLIGALPDVPEDTISEMGQSDIVIKLLTATQVCWMVFQVIVRASRSLHTSQLEISTVAFAVCTILAYIFWLDKPQNPVLIVPVECQRKPTPAECVEFAQLSSLLEPLLRVSFREAWSKESIFFWVLGAMGAVVFGSIHFFAWDFPFPTSIERDMWRASCIIMTSIPISGTLFVLFLDSENFPSSITSIVTMGLLFLYGLARLFICIECIRSLFHSEPNVFITTLTRSLPHIA